VNLTQEELSKVLDTPFVKVVHCNGVVHHTCQRQQNPSTSWGISRVNYKGSLASTDTLPYTFNYDDTDGQGVVVYILDTGVNQNHEQFTGRVVSPGYSSVVGEPDATVDQNGHGTHCAGTAAGITYGFAHHARIYPVKVLGRSGGGSFEGVIAGINHVAQQRVFPCIASMSLGAGSDGGMNAAVEAAIASGVPFSIAAGNSAADACNFYPASAEGAIAVGSTDLGAGELQDELSYFSNWGSCVKVFAPGSDIPSAYIPNANSYAVLSGTSMACPHVTGLGAVILSKNRGLTPAQLLQQLEDTANKDAILNPRNSPNLLIHNSC